MRLQSAEHLKRYTGTIQTFTDIIFKEGFASIFRGMLPTIWRNGVFNSLYFASIFYYNEHFPHSSNLQTFLFGTFAGGLAATGSHPFDVVKSRFQNERQLVGKLFTYRFTHQSLSLIFSEEGFKGLYRGYT